MSDKSPLEGVNFETGGDSPAGHPTSRAAGPPGEVTEDELRRVLADADRRSIVAFLAAEDEPVHRRAVLEHLAPDDGARRRVAARLHHVHLPKLVDAGLVVHDDDRDTLESGENTRRALRVLTAAPGDPVPIA